MYITYKSIIGFFKRGERERERERERLEVRN